jgi:hypothetical protein
MMDRKWAEGLGHPKIASSSSPSSASSFSFILLDSRLLLLLIKLVYIIYAILWLLEVNKDHFFCLSNQSVSHSVSLPPLPCNSTTSSKQQNFD